MGFIRQENINREIIRKISNDIRFELHYYGREQQAAFNLKSYVQEIGATNIYFHGEYIPKERYEFVRNTDIIHNIYCDANTMIAIGNKYYDGIIFRIPQLCMNGSFMGETVEKNGVGLQCDPANEQFCNIIYDYYTKINKEEFKKNCDDTLISILDEIDKNIKIITNIDMYEEYQGVLYGS